jgi:hypothetical protein
MLFNDNVRVAYVIYIDPLTLNKFHLSPIGCKQSCGSQENMQERHVVSLLTVSMMQGLPCFMGPNGHRSVN